MTELNVKDVLVDLADSVEVPDLASGAWDRSVRIRRRRASAGVGLVAATATIVAGTAYLRADNNAAVTPTHQSPSTPGPSDPTGPVLHGFAVAVAPTLPQEAGLPLTPSPLPPTIDLSAPNPSAVDQPLPSAVAAFAIEKIVGDATRFDGVMLIGPNAELRHLDAARLQPIQTGDGNGADPFTAGSLSPDGTRLAFPQPDGVAVFSIATGTWTDFAVSATANELLDLHWISNGSIRLGLTTLSLETGQTTRDRIGSPLYGTGLAVESWWGAERVLGDRHARAVSYLADDVAMDGVDSHPPAIAAAGAGMSSLLLIPDQQPRWKLCCAAAGWLDTETVAYESISSTDPIRPDQTTRVLGWNVVTGHVGLVTTVTGSTDMLFTASYADLAGVSG
jgi:hypothetical protein